MLVARGRVAFGRGDEIDEWPQQICFCLVDFGHGIEIVHIAKVGENMI